jgi:hypothetical protein
MTYEIPAVLYKKQSKTDLTETSRQLLSLLARTYLYDVSYKVHLAVFYLFRIILQTMTMFMKKY